ncbi:MAG: hypothetical protein HY865_19205 [Chloroflexi bacterium]|nr:hypothetical protein [Chloroflexota bacterium]
MSKSAPTARAPAAGQAWELPLFLVDGFAVRPHACGGASPLRTSAFSGWRLRCPPAVRQ